MSSSVRKERALKHLRKVSLALVSTVFLLPSTARAVNPSETVNQAIGSEGGSLAATLVVNATLAAIRSKPAMSAATTIVCVGCLPVAGGTGSPAMCIACGILIAKTLG